MQQVDTEANECRYKTQVKHYTVSNHGTTNLTDNTGHYHHM